MRKVRRGKEGWEQRKLKRCHRSDSFMPQPPFPPAIAANIVCPWTWPDSTKPQLHLLLPVPGPLCHQ